MVWNILLFVCHFSHNSLSLKSDVIFLFVCSIRKPKNNVANKQILCEINYNVAPGLKIPWLTHYSAFVAVQERKESWHVMTAKARAHRSILNLQKWKGWGDAISAAHFSVLHWWYRYPRYRNCSTGSHFKPFIMIVLELQTELCDFNFLKEFLMRGNCQMQKYPVF